MSMNNLTIDGEFRYIVQWFNEWSELQREDFVPILVKFITGSYMNDDDDDDITAPTTPVNMNGLPNDLEFSGRPMSLFQCRIKLFNQWNRRWPIEFKDKLRQKITEIDSKVGEKIELALNPNNSGSLTNGHALKDHHQDSIEQLQENVSSYMDNGQVEPMVLNDHMAEVLNNETSVDDIEANEDINSSIEQSLQTGNNEDVVADRNGAGNNNDCSKNTSDNEAINECAEPAQQVIQMQTLQISEENAEEDCGDATSTVEEKQQQKQLQLPSATVTVNPIVVTQTITANAEVPPLVV